ncbi:MAG: PAS domain S-box protein, partial [Pseudomonadota bacterium]
MTLDHSEFIKRYQADTPDKEKERQNTIKSLIISGIGVVLYLLGCILVAVLFSISMEMVIVAALSFLAATVVAFFVQRFRNTISVHEHQRQLILEVLEGSRGARLITDGADNPVYTNQRFDTLCEGVGESGLNTLTKLFLDNEEAYNHFKNLAEQARRGLTDSIELKSILSEREKWLMITAQPIAGWAGYIHWRIDDVTEQREVDRSIREEREKLIDFTDNAPVGFFSVDEKGRFVFVNGTLARWLGVSIEKLLENGTLHTYLENPPDSSNPYDIVDGGGERQVREMVMKGPAGKTFLASISQAVVDEGDGRVRTRGIMHDLTSEKEMRQALAASEDRFQKFFEEAPLGIIILDSEGIIQDCNAALAGMVGSRYEDIEGKNLKDIIKKDDQGTVSSALTKTAKSGDMQGPIEITLKDKQEVFVHLYARKFKGSDKTVLHFIDLTEQKELEEKFAQSQKMQAVGQLAGGVAHDFNNLLTAIIGYCDLLFLRHKPGDPSFGDIMQIKQNSNRAANLVRQLLAFSRQQTLRPSVHDVSDILTEVSYLIRRLIGANIELDLVHGQDLGLIKVDIGQMEQVLINLAVNARDAMEDGGKLSIETQSFSNTKPVQLTEDTLPPGQWVKIDVADTGCGIPEENLSRILEPFFTTKEVGQGTGLGLATVYGIIRQTGGYLDIQSTVGE